MAPAGSRGGWPRDPAGGGLCQFHADDAVWGADGAAAAFAAFDLVDVLHAFGDLAPDGVLAVEVGGRGEHDVELAVGAVRAGAAGGADGAADEFGGAGEFGGQVGVGT